jgi:hypothetical protein
MTEEDVFNFIAKNVKLEIEKYSEGWEYWCKNGIKAKLTITNPKTEEKIVLGEVFISKGKND